MKNVTFLLGAGASCNSMPLTVNLPNRIQEVIDKINNENFLPSAVGTLKSISPQKILLSESANEYITDLKWLQKMSSRHASIDTFAKKLFLTDVSSSDIFKLKNCLSVYFLIEQGIRAVDPRYDSFFASLLLSRKSMPKNIKVISWNYDLQFELGFQVYSGSKTLYDAQASLGYYHKFINNFVDSELHKSFGLYKLNGSCIMYGSSPSILKQNKYPEIPPNGLTVELLEELMQAYVRIKRDESTHKSGLSFAWEPDTSHLVKGITEVTRSACENTDILVVIGYSFPFFNREVDRAIINGMTKLKKVYIQSLSADDIIETFTSIRDDISKENVVPRYKCDQFFLPHEL